MPIRLRLCDNDNNCFTLATHLLNVMIVQTKNQQQVILRKLEKNDYGALFHYLNNLSPETKHRFGPHAFDMPTIVDFYESQSDHNGYLALDAESMEIVAYSIIKKGYLQHDSFRLQSYGLRLDNSTDCTYAPSVADAWQSQGVGNLVFHFIVKELRQAGIRRIILWGGVQCSNEKAVNFYLKNGFRTLGSFEYYGWNQDMVMELG